MSLVNVDIILFAQTQITVKITVEAFYIKRNIAGAEPPMGKKDAVVRMGTLQEICHRIMKSVKIQHILAEFAFFPHQETAHTEPFRLALNFRIVDLERELRGSYHDVGFPAGFPEGIRHLRQENSVGQYFEIRLGKAGPCDWEHFRNTGMQQRLSSHQVNILSFTMKEFGKTPKIAFELFQRQQFRFRMQIAEMRTTPAVQIAMLGQMNGKMKQRHGGGIDEASF